MGMVPHYDESTLIPSLPYFDLPAGLMVPLVKMEDSGYKPLDPKKIRQVFDYSYLVVLLIRFGGLLDLH